MDSIIGILRDLKQLWGEYPNFQTLMPDQVHQLENQGNVAADWSQIRFSSSKLQDLSRSLLRIRNCTFSGRIVIGNLEGSVRGPNNAQLLCGLQSTDFCGDCIVSDSCCVKDTVLLKDVFIGVRTVVIGCGSIVCSNDYDRLPSFGNNMTIEVGPETGGRSIVVHAGMSYGEICMQVLDRNRKASTSTGTGSLNDATQFAANLPVRCATVVGSNSVIASCDDIVDCLLGSNTTLKSSSVTNSTILSSSERPVSITSGARVSHCIISAACSLSMDCHADHVFMSECSSLGDFARVSHTVMGPDSSVAGGECHHCLLGPFVGFHHQSLLIAAIWPTGRGNVAYGAKIGANHTGRMNDQESWPGEGCFFGLGSIVKYPLNLSAAPYSIIAAGSTVPPQRVAFPFSLISVPDRPMYKQGHPLGAAVCAIRPGWVLHSNPYMIDRAAKKFLGRRKAQDHRTDFPVLRPYIVDTVRAARNRLVTALDARKQRTEHQQQQHQEQTNHSPRDQDQRQEVVSRSKEKDSVSVSDSFEVLTEKDVPGLGLCVMTIGDADKAVRCYTDFVRRYALHGLLYRLCVAKNHKKTKISSIDSGTGSGLVAADNNSSAAAAAVISSDRTGVLLAEESVKKKEEEEKEYDDLLLTRRWSPNSSTSIIDGDDDEEEEASSLFSAYIRDMANFSIDETPSSSEDSPTSSSSAAESSSSSSSSCFLPPPPPIGTKESSTGSDLLDSLLVSLIPESHRDSVWLHQLDTLQAEYPSVDIAAELRHFCCSSMTATTTATSDSATTTVTTTVAATTATAAAASATTASASSIPSMLRELVQLEAQHAAMVAECRARDGDKGRKVIPDYDVVNPVSVDVRLDAIVVEADERAKKIAFAVDSLLL